MDREAKLIFTGIVGIIVVGLLIFLSPFTIIDTTERGVVLQWGAVDRTLDEGVHWRTPIAEDVIKMPVNIQKIEVAASAASKDLQEVSTTIALQYRLDPTKVGTIYSDLKKDWQVVVIDPAIQDVVKAVTAKFNAEELVGEREAVKQQIAERLKNRLEAENLLVVNVDIVNFQFSPEFDRAIEEKVTAEQNAKREENNLKRVEFEAQQSIEQAKADAERTRLEAEALKQNVELIGKIEAEARLKAAEKWDGRIPDNMTITIVGGQDGSTEIPVIPFMNLGR